MTFGLTPEQLVFIRETIVAPLKAHGADVYVYGSRARGDHRPFSDLDLMVEAPATIAPALSAARERVEKGNFPYKIDLVLLSEFAEAYKPGYLRDRTLFPA